MNKILGIVLSSVALFCALGMGIHIGYEKIKVTGCKEAMLKQYEQQNGPVQKDQAVFFDSLATQLCKQLLN